MVNQIRELFFRLCPANFRCTNFETCRHSTKIFGTVAKVLARHSNNECSVLINSTNRKWWKCSQGLQQLQNTSVQQIVLSFEAIAGSISRFYFCSSENQTFNAWFNRHFRIVFKRSHKTGRISKDSPSIPQVGRFSAWNSARIVHST